MNQANFLSGASDSFSLRERKYARSKRALLEAAIRRMETTPFEEIKTRDLCRDVELSEATFFNYFPKKSDLLFYYIQLWTLEMAHLARRRPGNRGGVDLVETLFRETARRAAKNPVLMLEILSFQVRNRERPELPPLSPAEKAMAFPAIGDLTELDGLPEEGLGDILPEALAEALDMGQLPPKTNLKTVFTSLIAIFFGVPALLARTTPGSFKTLEEEFNAQLQLLWAGVRAGAALSSTKSKKRANRKPDR